MMHDLRDLVDQHTIAERCGVQHTAVNNWTQRYPSFPEPIERFGNTPVYSWAEIKSWFIGQFGKERWRAVSS